MTASSSDNRETNASASLVRRLPWWSRRRPASLTMRLMSLAMLWAFGIFALATFGLWWTAELVIKDNMRRQAQQWLSKFDDLGTPLLVSSDPSQFEPIRKHIANFPEIVFLRYVAPDGHTELGRFVGAGVDERLFPPFSADNLEFLTKLGSERPILEQEPARSGILRVSMPTIIRSISRDGLIAFTLEHDLHENAKVIGFVDIGLDFLSYRKNLGRHILLGSLLIFGLFILTSLLGRFIIRHALRPLADLQIPLARLARGETDIEVESRGTSEIAAIGSALNTTIAALKERDRELQRLATYDTLTGLYNRYSFNRELEREKARVLLEEHTSALIFLDLDRFKEVNDTVGHAAGDELLFQVARLLSSKVRADDVLARLGGDEFTIILRNVSEPQAQTIAGQVCAAMRDFTFAANGQSFRVHCSIGLTIIDASPATPAELLSQADTACHEAKNHGRDCYKLYRDIAPDEILSLDGSGLREQIEQALATESFMLSYFPIINCRTKAIDGYEVFVQMNSNEREIPARAFFAAAERFDLAPRIDRWVVGTALRQLAASSTASLSISINLCGRTMQQEDIVDHIRNALADNRLDPKRISFEIPERAVLDSVTQTKNFMEKLKELGCGVIIDDFGISLNSINLLKSLPVDRLKIEATLVASASTSPFSQAVIASIVRIARELEIKTVAKGVTRNEEASDLCKLGVQYLQGQEIGPPLHRLP